MKQSHNGTSWLFQHGLKVLTLNTHFKMQNMCFSTWSFSTWNAQQNYPTMSREHSVKKLLVTTEDILHKSLFKFWISEACGLQTSNFLFSVMMRLLLTVMGRVTGKPNCHLGGSKLSAF